MGQIERYFRPVCWQQVPIIDQHKLQRYAYGLNFGSSTDAEGFFSHVDNIIHQVFII